MTLRIVLASNNAKKLSELRVLLAGVAVQLVPQSELGISEAEEPHFTFIENALAKARHAALACGGAAIADDSGVCVDALGGQPGVASAHFADAGLARRCRIARPDAACRTLPTTPCCCNACKVLPTAVRTSSAPWWPCVMRKTRSPWWPRVAGRVRS
jgi:hypothetical protein